MSRCRYDLPSRCNSSVTFASECNYALCCTYVRSMYARVYVCMYVCVYVCMYVQYIQKEAVIAPHPKTPKMSIFALSLPRYHSFKNPALLWRAVQLQGKASLGFSLRKTINCLSDKICKLWSPWILSVRFAWPSQRFVLLQISHTNRLTSTNFASSLLGWFFTSLYGREKDISSDFPVIVSVWNYFMTFSWWSNCGVSGWMVWYIYARSAGHSRLSVWPRWATYIHTMFVLPIVRVL